jgi:two-component system nitrogen regulation sensor histidine kinase NtrY
LKKEAEVKSEFSLSVKNKIYRFEGTFIPLFVVGRYSLGSYCKLTDLSAAIEAERAKVYSHSVQKIAHEIKTPLSSILFTVKTLELRLKQEKTTSDEEILEDVSLIEKEVLRMKSLTNNLLKFANLQTPKLDEVQFSNVVEGALAKFDSYRGKGIEFIVNGCHDKFILGDMYQLIEALQVIIENGIDSMNGRGKILINCTRESVNERYYMKLTISDDGPGIKKDIKNILFDPYVTTKKEGTGMGLAIAKKIIEDHGSDITFVTGSTGTTFIIYLTCIEKGN